jgi:hypothetical protein
MANVELVALTTDVGVHGFSVARGQRVRGNSCFSFCGELNLGLAVFVDVRS